MPDHAISTDPAVQEQLDRLWALSPGADILGLDRITQLLARIGDPHLRLPPVLHVAGTNGKGSTCAFLRAALEAAGYRVHAYTSPHLVRFNERIRLAGTLIDDAMLASLLAEVLDAGGAIGASFFEVTTAAAFLAFSRIPADACVIEVGLGGRLDATNVIPAPVACGIAALGIDHQSFLGDTLAQIAREKAGIAKPGAPLVTMNYPPDINALIVDVARTADAPVIANARDWRHDAHSATSTLTYTDAVGALVLPLPTLPGAHQADNLALAVSMLHHQTTLAVPLAALEQASRTARWPARLQRLAPGPLTALAGGTPVWLDGGHNASAGQAIAAAIDRIVDPAADRPLTLIVGMLANKDPAGFIAPISRYVRRLIALPVPGHPHHTPADLARSADSFGIPETNEADSIAQALSGVADTAGGAILIAGSLYLAGEVLAANDEPPE